MTNTTGPWSLNPARSTRVDLIDNAKGEAVGEIVWVDVRDPAVARLIVKAPELLALVNRILDDVDADRADGLGEPDWANDARDLVGVIV